MILTVFLLFVVVVVPHPVLPIKGREFHEVALDESISTLAIRASALIPTYESEVRMPTAKEHHATGLRK